MARVLVVSFSVVPGPDRHGVQLLHVLRALSSRFTVDVLTLRVGDLAYVERYQKTRMLRVPVPDAPLGDQIESFRRALKRQLEGAEYDVVHFRDAWSGAAVIERQKQLGYKTVFDVGRSALGEPRPADVKLASELARDEDYCCERADLVLATTELGRRFLSAKGRPERFVVVPPGVDVDRFDAEPSDLPEKGSSSPRVLYAGTLGPGKGVRVLLRAFQFIRQEIPARLLLAGPIQTGFGEPLWSAIDQLGLTGAVELLGPIDNEDMPRVISRAAVCVAPAAADVHERPTACFPTKVLEYLACRRATVAARRSSLGEVLQHGVEGMLFEPGDPRDLADKLSILLKDPVVRERVATAGRERVRDRFPASATRRKLLEAYVRLLPAASWNPLGQAMPPIPIPQTGSGRGATGSMRAADPGDTNPAIDGDPFAAAGPTVITAMPGAADTPSLGTASSQPDDMTIATRGVGESTDPWIVVGLDGSNTRPRAPADSSDGEGTPAEGTTGDTPSLGVGFVAGELEARPRAAGASSPPVEEPLVDLSFTAASELLSSKKDG